MQSVMILPGTVMVEVTTEGDMSAAEYRQRWTEWQLSMGTNK